MKNETKTSKASHSQQDPPPDGQIGAHEKGNSNQQEVRKKQSRVLDDPFCKKVLHLKEIYYMV